MKPLIWIIDEEWPDYKVETELLKTRFPDGVIRRSTYDYEADLKEYGYRADLILAQIYVPLPESTIRQLTCCKGIAVYGGGYDRIDIQAAKEMGIKVTNVQGYCAEDLADYVMAAIYNHNKGITEYRNAAETGQWGALAVKRSSHRINVSTLMVIGCGTIGRAVAGKAKALGMRVLGYDPHVSDEVLKQEGIEPTAWIAGLGQADYISINVKLTPETEGLIGKEDFAYMKPNAYLINTARGKLIVEQELIEACKSGRIAGACLDVIETEPPVGTEAIFFCKNIIVTPHISYISQESFFDLKARTVKNAICMYEGGEPQDWVNR